MTENEMNEAIDRAFQRILSMITCGRITLVDDTGAIQKLQVKINNAQVLDNVPHLMQFGFTSNPPVGTDVGLAFAGGDRNNGFAVGSNNLTSRPTGLQSGESQMYDSFGKSIYLSDGAIFINANGAPVKIENATTLTINASDSVVMNTPILKVSGDIIDNTSAGNTDNLGDMRTHYNNHKHPGVQVGGGTTGLTTDPM